MPAAMNEAVENCCAPRDCCIVARRISLLYNARIDMQITKIARVKKVTLDLSERLVKIVKFILHRAVVKSLPGKLRSCIDLLRRSPAPLTARPSRLDCGG